MTDTEWDREVRDIAPALFRYFRARFALADAEDLVQEVLIRLVQKVERGQYNAKLGSLRMFAFGIAHFVSLETRRIPVFLPETATVDPLDHSFEESCEKASVAVSLRRHLQDLSEVERQVVTLMIDEELNLAAIAVILQVPENTVKSHVHRAKQKLAARMNPQVVVQNSR